MIELTLKFKEPEVDGLPDRDCKCLIFTDTGHFYEVPFSVEAKAFNAYDKIDIKEICYYVELPYNNNAFRKMNEKAETAWIKREGYKEI